MIRSEAIANDGGQSNQTQSNQHDDANGYRDITCDHFIFHYQSPVFQMKFEAGLWSLAVGPVPHPRGHNPAQMPDKF
jgi:hypothetical protein